jgi:hypothetical protein
MRPSSVFVDLGDSRRTPYSKFLAGPEMADLQLLAKMMLQGRPRQDFVEPFASHRSGRDTAPKPAIELLESLVPKSDDRRTNVVFMTADAGVGKTSTLRELVRRQAGAVVRNESNLLYLYVDAQGRALARFNEALATELQDLRSRITYHAISTLVRRGLIVPVVDGFDELIGTRGSYDDAFSSLAAFIEELDGRGSILASARSAYYEREFVTRANSASALGRQMWRQETVDILDWRPQEYQQYLRLRFAAEHKSPEESGVISERMQTAFSGDSAALKGKPFFVARAYELAASGETAADGPLLPALVQAFERREVEHKLLDRRGAPLLTPGQLEELLVELSREMWRQETRELDATSVRDIGSLFAQSEGLSSDGEALLRERLPSIAFLTGGGGSRVGGVAFEHELYFSYFLAIPLSTVVRAGGVQLRIALGRSPLPPEVAEAAIARGADPLADLERLMELGVDELGAGQLAFNVGLLAAQCMTALGTLKAVKLKNLTLAGVDLNGVRIEECELRGITIRVADCRQFKVIRSTGENVMLIDPLVKPGETVLDLTGLDYLSDVVGLRVTGQDGDIRSVYGPVEVREVLAACGLPSAQVSTSVRLRAVDDEMLNLVQVLADAFERTNLVCEGEDNQLSWVFESPLWRKLRRALLENEIVTLETKSASGPHKDFLRRRVMPADLLVGAVQDAPASPAVRDFWADLERK